MIQPLTLEEEINLLPPLTPEEQAVCDSIDFNAIIAKMHAMMPPEERPKWQVIDDRGGSIKLFFKESDAYDDATERNYRAGNYGVYARYHVIRYVT